MPRISSTRPHSGIAAQRVTGFAAAAGLFRRFSRGRSRNLRCAFYFAFFFTCNFHLFYTFPKSVLYFS